MNQLVTRPPTREWIPFSTSADGHLYKVKMIQSDSSILGRVFHVARVELQKPPKYCKQVVFDILIMDTLNARRCEKKLVKLRRISTMDSCFFIVHEIIDG